MKYCFFLLATLFQITCIGQWQVGIQGMANFCTANINTTGSENISWRLKPGFGLVSEIELSKEFTLRPSINFLQKGVRSEFKPYGRNSGYITEIDFSFIEVPIVGAFNVELNKSKGYFGVGPSIGLVITGSSKHTTTVFSPQQNPTTTTNLLRSQKVEISGNLVAGVQFGNGIFINLGALASFRRFYDYYDFDSFKNYGLQLTVGYFIWNKRDNKQKILIS